MAAVMAGPGLTNTVTAVKNAQMAESPLLLIGGAAATLLQVRKCLMSYVLFMRMSPAYLLSALVSLCLYSVLIFSLYLCLVQTLGFISTPEGFSGN